jgi:hypothetical protein
VAFVLLGDYLRFADRVVDEHPGGRLVEARRGDEVLFTAYVLP